jgi:hypothetical protein
MAVHFKEEQYFSRNILWVTVLFLPVLMLVVLFYQLYSGELVGDYPMSNTSITILSIIYFIPAVLAFFFVKLSCIVEDEKIMYGWNIPDKVMNEIHFSEISSYKIIQYDFVGYGYRISQQYGTVYNVSGSWGLQVVKKNGEKILIGTHRPEEIKAVLDARIQAPGLSGNL